MTGSRDGAEWAHHAVFVVRPGDDPGGTRCLPAPLERSCMDAGGDYPCTLRTIFSISAAV